MSFKPWERVEIFGRNAFLVVEDQFELTLYDEETGPAKSWRPSIPNTLMFDESFGGYSGLLENVLDAVRGLAPLAATGRDGAAAVALIEAIRRSIEQRRGNRPLQPKGSVRMKIKKLETFLANAGLRNYLFVRLTTDTGLTGIGEATLEWQEKAVEVLLHEWVASRILGRDPFDIEAVVGGMIRDQYQGGSTVMTAISGVEIALWDLIGKACGQPVYRLLGGRRQARAAGLCQRLVRRLRSAGGVRRAGARGRGARLRRDEVRPVRHRLEGAQPGAGEPALAVVEAVAEAVGPEVGLMIEFHGRLAAGDAIRFIRKLEGYDILLVRGAGRAGEPRAAGGGQGRDAACRSRPASGSTRWPTSPG